MTQINLFSQSWNTIWKILPGYSNCCIIFVDALAIVKSQVAKVTVPEVVRKF
jgi:hypothetical protein